MHERQLPDPNDEADRRLLANVTEFGWHIVGIFEDEEGPRYNFSVGIFHTLDHPEIVIFGLRHEVAATLINDIGDLIRNGSKFEHGDQSHDIAAGFPMAFVTFPTQHYLDYLGSAIWFYQSSKFPVLQCVWPDREGRFPWQPGFDERFHPIQPVLGPCP